MCCKMYEEERRLMEIQLSRTGRYLPRYPMSGGTAQDANVFTFPPNFSSIGGKIK